MKRFFPALLLASTSFTPILAEAPAVASPQYSNETIGVRLSSAPGWSIYTDHVSASEEFKDSFPEDKDPDDSPLFVGKLDQAPLYMRCIYEESEVSLDDYLLMLKETGKSEKIKILGIERLTDTEAEWRFETHLEGNRLLFRERIIRHSDRFIRIGFWTIAALFARYETQMGQFIQQISLHDGDDRWTPIAALRIADQERPSANADPEKRANPSDPGAIFYTFTGKKNRVHILGSLHFGLPDFYPFPPTIEKSFESSTYLVLEADVRPEAAAKIRSEMQQLIQLPEGQSLSGVLSPPFYLKVKGAFDAHGLNIEKFGRFRPWFIALFLSSVQVMSEGFIREEGVENYFIKKMDGKELVELEGAIPQMKIFETIDGETFLAYTMLTMNSTGTHLKRIAEAWRAGDEKRLEQILIREPIGLMPESEGIDRALNADRNLKMADTIREYLENGDRDYFVVVGTGHLIGENGLVSLLKQRGYTGLKFTGGAKE